MRVAVLGLGLIGGSVALAARDRADGVTVAGFDPDPAALAGALAGGAVDEACDSPAAALEGAAICFLCAPVTVLPALLAETLAAAPADCVVTDVGSTKLGIVRATDDERFVGGHPIAGSEAAGIEHARADLFEGAPWYLTPGTRSSGVLYERLYRLISDFGARPSAIDAETHDRMLAKVSHLPHVVANILVAQAGEGGDTLPRVGPSFRDATRVAGANSGIWTGIYTTNAEAIADEVEAAAARLSDFAGLLRAGDAAAIESWNESAREDRRRLLEADLEGGVLHELHVSVPNQPGIVAQVALALGKGGVNIVDMALAPAPDNRSGSITLWIAGDDPAAKARELIGQLGFPVLEPS
ncbi:MAG: prephenate dehydrogenase [Thermoleophilaceae bacterium]|nr:prephenate dehydrogenase [Thermoleophilaceae bacterium]